MATPDLESILTLLNRWETHWSDVNAVLRTSDLILATEFTVASLADERAAFIADEQQIQAAENPAQGAATERDALKKALRTRISQLRAAVQGILPGTRYVGMLPSLPATNAGEGIFLKALEDSVQLWAMINSDTSLSEFVPLNLPVGYPQAQLVADTATLRGHYQSATQNREHARTLRAGRAARRKALLARLTQYRKVLVARLPAGHPLLGTVPAP